MAWLPFEVSRSSTTFNVIILKAELLGPLFLAFSNAFLMYAFSSMMTSDSRVAILFIFAKCKKEMYSAGVNCGDPMIQLLTWNEKMSFASLFGLIALELCPAYKVQPKSFERK